MTLTGKTRIILLLVCICQLTAAGAYEVDVNDFAIEVFDCCSCPTGYVEGSGAGIYDDPSTALGRPSIDTLYWGVPRPVLPVFAAWGTDQVATIGTGGCLALKFNHKVADDKNNPYGYDLIIFGNQMQGIIGDDWTYGDPCEAIFDSEQVKSELGKVCVSQDGNDWYCFENGPYADSFAPTLGRVYDTANPNDSYEGWENLWWGEVTNPTLPLDPNLEPSDFAGNTVAYVCQAYGESAGGTAFDLQWLAPENYNALEVDPQTGRRWIQYVKIEANGIDKPEIDAISDVAACGDYKHPFPVGDLNEDCRVDFVDFTILAKDWLVGNDWEDLAALADSWLQCNWECE